MIKLPRFSRTSTHATKFLKKYNINKLPVDPFIAILQNINWKHMTYEQFAYRHKISIKEVIEITDSIDGCSFFNASKNKYLILYNNNPLYIYEPRRITWTLMHEIGHIVLGHLKETGDAMISRGILTQDKYEQFEKEAHFFAACVLAPYILLHKLNLNNFRLIMDFCGLSKEAAQKREIGLKKWLKSKKISTSDMSILFQFSNFIYQKKCSNCLHGFFSVNAKFCPICGNKLIWGEGEMIYTDGYPLDHNSKAVICPRCNNEQINYDHDRYCHICGTFLTNMCANVVDTDYNGNEYVVKQSCGALAGSSARYCTQCGNPTTYLVDNLFSHWQEAKKKLEAAATSENPSKPKLRAVSKKEEDIPF